MIEDIMKKRKSLILFMFVQLVWLNNSFALTPEECNQSGGSCICIAFPGADPVCTQSNQNSLVLEDEREKKSCVYMGFAQF